MSAAASTITTAEMEPKTYWCHQCDMSVALTSPPSSSTLLCPHCRSHQFLEPMDFIQPDPNPFPDALSPLDAPYLLRLFQHHLISTATDDDYHQNDAVIEDVAEDPSPDNAADSIPTIVVSDSLLSELDSSGAVLCAVCKEPILAGAEAKQLPCKHLYHCDCIVPWLVHHDSCPLCRFQLGCPKQEEEEEGVVRERRIRRQLRMAMMSLSELMDEEGEDFYGLRTTLSHIAHRHGLLNADTASIQNESEIMSIGSNGDLEPVERGMLGLLLSGDT